MSHSGSASRLLASTYLTTQMLGGLLVIPNWDMPSLEELPPFKNLVTWTAVDVFGVTRPLVITGSGSGDKTFNWIAALCLLGIATGATVVWSVLDRQRENYVTLNKWFHLFMRFAAGSTMLAYGMVKAVPMQMPAPFLTRLVEPFGNFSPMGVLWSSIGASAAYERFAGAAELTAAVCLFIPRFVPGRCTDPARGFYSDLHAEHDLRRAGEAVLVSCPPDVAGTACPRRATPAERARAQSPRAPFNAATAVLRTTSAPNGHHRANRLRRVIRRHEHRCPPERAGSAMAAVRPSHLSMASGMLRR